MTEENPMKLGIWIFGLAYIALLIWFMRMIYAL